MKTLPKPPYYAVIFTSQLKVEEPQYQEWAQKMEELATEYEGFLGIDSTRDASGYGITISYWKSLEVIQRWKADTTHQIAQKKGRADWYQSYQVQIAKVERCYDFSVRL